MSLSTLILRRLQVDAVLLEPRRQQRLRLDLELSPDSSVALRSDRKDDALDAHAVARSVREIVRQHPSVLLERLLCVVAKELLRRYPVRAVQIEGEKPADDSDPYAVVVRVQLDRSAMHELERADSRFED